MISSNNAVISFIISSLKTARFFRRLRKKIFVQSFLIHLFLLAIELTCFADPIEITVQFALKLLLSSQLQEGLSVLHLLSLLRKLSTSVIQMTWQLIQEHKG